MKKYRFICLLIAVLWIQKSYAQDIHFSQFYESNILRNPALTGVFSGDYRVSAGYRNQWSSISNPFITGQLSFETRIPVSNEINDFFSAGFMAYYDKAGSIDMKSLAVYPAVSYNKSLEDAHNSFISVGFAGGYIQRSYDPTKMTVNNQYQGGVFNPDNPTGENGLNPKINYWDLGAGVNFSGSGGENNNATYFIGVSAFHLTKPKTSFYNSNLVNLDTKWNLNAGLTYKVNENVGALAQLNYAKQGSYSELIGGGMINYRKPSERDDDPVYVFYIGAFYRLNDAIIPVIKLDYMRYSFGFSYDVNISKLKEASNLRGGYELSIVRTGLFKDPRWEKSRTVCPHAFF